MLQLVDGLAPVQAPLLLGDTLPSAIDPHHFRPSLDRHLFSAISSGNGIVIRIEPDSAEPIYPARSTLTGVKGLTWQRV